MSGEPSRFWNFSLAVHAADGVEAECLDLQDRHGVDVDLLLFCAYAGAVHGAKLSAGEIKEAAQLVGEWQKAIVSSLRTARRALKPFAGSAAPTAAAAAALRGTVKAAELEAERLEHAMLEEWSASRQRQWTRQAAADAVAANIRTLFATPGATNGDPQLPAHLVAAALAAALPAG